MYFLCVLISMKSCECILMPGGLDVAIGLRYPGELVHKTRPAILMRQAHELASETGPVILSVHQQELTTSAIQPMASQVYASESE